MSKDLVEMRIGYATLLLPVSAAHVVQKALMGAKLVDYTYIKCSPSRSLRTLVTLKTHVKTIESEERTFDATDVSTKMFERWKEVIGEALANDSSIDTEDLMGIDEFARINGESHD